MIKSKHQGLLVVISAPSGAGKGSVINEMLNKVRICGKTIKDIWNDVIF